jgi:hypothetical protein
MQFNINYADAGLSAPFDRKPSVYFTGGAGKLKDKFQSIKVLTKTYPADEVECLFKVKIPADTYSLYVSTKKEGEKLVSSEFYVLGPTVTKEVHFWGVPGETVTMTGSYFGNTRPLLQMEFFDPDTGAYRILKCKVQNAKTYMDPVSGASDLQFTVPKKMPAEIVSLLRLTSPQGEDQIAFSGFDFNREDNIETPLRDGVILRGNLYTPLSSAAAKGTTYPVLIFRTPYSKDDVDPYDEKTFRNAVKRGYAVLMQDVRGRYASDGDYNPYQNETNDGYDTIEWAAVQSWSDGNVGTFGLSYPGGVQWLSAIATPPHLKAMVPAMVPSTMNQCIYFGGIFEIAWTGWCYKYMSPDIRVRKGLEGPQTVTEARREYNRIGENTFAGYLPTLELPYMLDTCGFYYEWIANPPYSDYYAFGEFRQHYPEVKAAVLNLSGWYDEAYGSEGATTNYLGLLASRAGDADKKNKLIIGPWIHGVDATQSTVSGDRKFPDNARIDYDATVLDWLDYYVRGIENGVPDWPAVQVYQMEADGKGQWVTDTAWPLTGTEETSLYLIPAQAGASAGTLSWIQPTQSYEASSFSADPAEPVDDPNGTNFGASNLAYLADREDVLTFDSEKLKAPVRVIGPVKAEIYLSADAPDCDLYVKLLDVAPDGTVFNLTGPGQEGLRISYRNQTSTRALLTSGEVVKLNFENVRTGNVFGKGHQLRVCICASWFPIYSRNLQTGELESTSSATQKATISIHHALEQQSKMILPVIPAE